ncbi:Variant surface glycoprotein [Trypanosoma congolense IL3000]|uniref:Variant surface glycoprotein n=1 Tax=Trypanosoma congolense (strain IL3000) TaxID=1068625 RepID=F9WAB3_TRYCI|nr:Variant surface glycoprotein [Trypanosoma congolense IL3000]
MKPCSPLDPLREAAATIISWKPSVDRPGPSSRPPLSFGSLKSLLLTSLRVCVQVHCLVTGLIAYVVFLFLCSTHGAGDGVIVKKGMWFWMVMVVGVVTGTAAGKMVKSHNHHELADLCEVLGAAVILSNCGAAGARLRKALGQVIFWKHAGGNLENLQKVFPEEYGKECAEPTHWGSSYTTTLTTTPGKSIPHDLLCMCTVGSGGFPFYSGTDNTRTLCHKSAKELGCGMGSGSGCPNGHGWTETNSNNHASKHLKATWDSIVKTCLTKAPNTTLEHAQNSLEEHLNPKDGYSSVFWARGHTTCGGVNGDICVNYNKCDKASGRDFPQWWEALQDALPTANFDYTADMNTTGFSNTTFDEGEEEEEWQTQGASGKGIHHGPSSIRRHRKRSSHAVSHLFKEDGTPLTLPFLWPLGAFVSWL